MFFLFVVSSVFLCFLCLWLLSISVICLSVHFLSPYGMFFHGHFVSLRCCLLTLLCVSLWSFYVSLLLSYISFGCLDIGLCLFVLFSISHLFLFLNGLSVCGHLDF